MASSRPQSTQDVLSLLRSNISRIGEHSAHLTSEQLRTAPGPEEWSANDVLAHIRSCADVWGGCIARIRAEDKTTIRAVDPRTWMKSTDYPELEFRASFLAYDAQRADLVLLLESLSDEAWMRSATARLSRSAALCRSSKRRACIPETRPE